MCGGAKTSGSSALKTIKSIPLFLNDPTGGYLTGGLFDQKGATNQSMADLFEGIGNKSVRAWEQGIGEGDWGGAFNTMKDKNYGRDTMNEGAESRRAREAAAAAAGATPDDDSQVDSYAMSNTGFGVGDPKKRTRKHGMRQNILTSGQGLQLS